MYPTQYTSCRVTTTLMATIRRQSELIVYGYCVRTTGTHFLIQMGLESLTRVQSQVVFDTFFVLGLSCFSSSTFPSSSSSTLSSSSGWGRVYHRLTLMPVRKSIAVAETLRKPLPLPPPPPPPTMPPTIVPPPH